MARSGGERPEAWVYAVSAACWAALLLAAPIPFVHSGQAHGPSAAGFSWAPALAHWLLMIGAMMLPMAAMAVRHVAFRSFRRRRARATGLFLLGYGAVWLAAAPLYLAAAAAGVPAAVALTAAAAAAAAWQAAPAKRRALRRCHRTVPLAPSGWRADRDCLVFGLAHGRACLASCWALMLIPAAAAHHPAAMLLVGLFGLCERRSLAAEPLRRPADARAALAALLPSAAPLRAR